MPCYDILGLSVELPWELNECALSARPPDMEIACGPAAAEAADSADAPWMRVQGEHVYLNFPEICAVDVTPGRALVTPYHGVDPESLRRIVVDHVLPPLLSREGRLVLHASAVELGAGLIGFVAESGWGKSTLALSLALAGGALFTDDALVIDTDDGEPRARPLWHSARIKHADLPPETPRNPFRSSWEKAAVEEGALPGLRFAREPCAVRAIYLLGEPSAEVSIRALSPRDALLGLLKHLFHLEPDELEGANELMRRIESLGLTRRTYELRYPRDRARLSEVRTALLAHLAATSAPPAD